MANTQLPLSMNTLDTATPYRQMHQDQQSTAMNHEQILSAHYQNMDAREKSRLTSVISGAVQLKSFLDSDDLGGAYDFLQRRKSSIQQRMGGGENIDTEDTDAAMEMLRSGDIQGLKSTIDGLMAAGTVYGIIDPNYGVGGDTGALINRLIKEGSAKNVQDALQQIKGGAGQMGKNMADINTGFDANYATQSGQNQSNVDYAAEKGYQETAGKNAAESVIANDKTINSLGDLEFSIQQAEQLLPQVSMTGPIMGRVGNAAEDPNYKNLQGAINAITLQAKDLYNLGSGAGFTDADRDFLREVVAGQYARAETIQMGLKRFKEVLQRRKQNLQQQNSQYQGQYGQGQTNQQPSQAMQFSGQEVTVTNGNETVIIPIEDLPAAQAEGYRQL